MEVTRTFDIVDQLVKEKYRDDALAVKRNGKWEKFSAAQYKEFVDNFSYGLLALGFEKGDKILTISNNRPEWNFVDAGMTQVGVVHVPVYPNQGPEEYEHILRHSDARILIVSSQEYFDRIKPFVERAPNIKKVYAFDEVAGASGWMEIIETGKANAEKYRTTLEEIKASIQPDDMMSIIYTSGSTGLSKGVMLSHRNFIANVKGSYPVLPLSQEEIFLSFLPLCHVFERMVNYLLQYRGCGIYYAESVDTIGENLREVKPHGFASVPRVIERLYDKLLLKGKELKGMKKNIYFWAVDLGFVPGSRSSKATALRKPLR